MSEKLCVFCTNFGWGEISMYDYGGETGAGIDGHYCDVRPYSTEEFRATLLRAETCPDYEQVKP